MRVTSFILMSRRIEAHDDVYQMSITADMTTDEILRFFGFVGTEPPDAVRAMLPGPKALEARQSLKQLGDGIIEGEFEDD